MKSLMLQANSSGAWRNVLAFDPAHRDEVKAAAAKLAAAAGVPMRIAFDNVAQESCRAPLFQWTARP